MTLSAARSSSFNCSVRMMCALVEVYFKTRAGVVVPLICFMYPANVALPDEASTLAGVPCFVFFNAWRRGCSSPFR